MAKEREEKRLQFDSSGNSTYIDASTSAEVHELRELIRKMTERKIESIQLMHTAHPHSSPSLPSTVHQQPLVTQPENRISIFNMRYVGSEDTIQTCPSAISAQFLAGQGGVWYSQPVQALTLDVRLPVVHVLPYIRSIEDFNLLIRLILAKEIFRKYIVSALKFQSNSIYHIVISLSISCHVVSYHLIMSSLLH